MMMMVMMMMMMIVMDHMYIYILKVHRHGISEIRNPSAIPARSNVRVAPYNFHGRDSNHQFIWEEHGNCMVSLLMYWEFNGISTYRWKTY